MKPSLRRLSLGFCLCLLLSTVVAVRLASASNDLLTMAKGKLDAVRLGKFQLFYAELEQAEKDEQRAIEAAEKADPLFRDAKRGITSTDGSYEKAKYALENAEDEIAMKSPGLMADYRRWRELYSKSLCAERIKTFAADPAKRAWTLWGGRTTIKWLASVSEGALPPYLKGALPKPDAKLTDDDVLAILEKMSRLPDDERAELQRLEQKLQQVRLPRKEVDAFDVVNARRLAHTMYLQDHTPDSVKSARANVARIINEMTTVWPDWRETYAKIR